MLKINKLIAAFKNSSGFTLIELLVVIGILGILAAGLLATIDPLEQFRKGADSNRKTTGLELLNALTRYYAVHETYPWDDTAAGGSECMGAGVVPNTTSVSQQSAASAFGPCLDQLVLEGEIKSTLPTQYGILSNLVITDTTVGTAKSAVVCFDPESKSESLRPETKYTSAGDASCDPTASTTCYWCAQ
ncbi:MAG: type II secretion system protein [Candidatus Levyibacteriota bacterium]